MKTIVHKNDGRFSSFGIHTDDITDVDLLVKIIRAAENDDNTSFTDDEQRRINNIKEDCINITEVKHKPLF